VDPSKLFEDYKTALSGVSESRALQGLDLSDDELSDVTAGVDCLSEPLRQVCLLLVNEWATLDVGSRLAGLLVLANGLAEAGTDDGGPDSSDRP
jgi:hypothetical protein